MHTSKSQICNMAISFLRQTETTIANLDTDAGDTATLCRIHYDPAREFVLSDYAWKFAEKRVALALTGSAPDDWLYRYDYPSDCLTPLEILRLTTNDDEIPFKVELKEGGSGLSILTDQKEAVLIYTSDVENTTLFSPGFVTSFAMYLATVIGPGLGADRRDIQEIAAKYASAKLSAESIDSRSQHQRPERDSSWDRERY